MKKLINKYITFIKYILSSGTCFAIDLLLFTIFNYLFKGIGSISILLSTVLARIISSCINYLLNRNKVFNKGNGKADTESLIKYALLVIIQMLVSSFSVMYIYKLTKFNETLIKIPVDIVLFIVNFFVQKLFIFNNKEHVFKEKNNTYLFILSIISTISLIVNPAIEGPVKVVFNEIGILGLVLSILLYLFYKKFYNKTERRKSFKIISIIFSLLLILGYSFNQIDSFYYVFSNIQYVILSIIKLFGYYELFNLSLNLLYEYLTKLNLNKEYNCKFINCFKEHPFLFTFVILFVIYSVYLIAYYPGVVGYDPSYQIKEYLGMPNFYSESLNLDQSKTMITAFNPVLHTLLIGSLTKFGIEAGSANYGIFLYTFIQMIAVIFVLSYSIKFLHDEKLSIQALLIIIGIYVFVPFFPFYSICAFKDTYFSLFFMLFIIELYKAIKYKLNIKKTILLVLVSLGLCLTRNNGLITVLLTLLFFLGIKKNRKYILLSIIMVLLLNFTYNKTLTYFGVPGTSIREVMSAPFQQTAALIVNKENVIESEDMDTIVKILDIDVIKNEYDPELSDKVKNTYNNDASSEDLINYFKVWAKYLVKEPVIYIEATMNNIYGYFYPNTHQWYFYYKKYNVLNDVGINYHYNKLNILRKVLYGYSEVFAYIPVIGLLVNIGATTWGYIYLIGHLNERKNKKYILLLIPMITILMACMVGPVNTYYRYVLPYSSTLPLILGIIYTNKKETNNA